MLNSLTIFIFFLSILFGIAFPRKSGWAMIVLVPILGPAGFIISPSPFFPLTMHRLAFGITIGILLSKHADLPFRFLYRNLFVRMLMIFSLLLLFASLKDGLMPFFSNYLTKIISSVLLCYIIIRDDKDVRLLINIFVTQSTIISFFVMLEFFTHFSIYHFIHSLYPQMNSSLIGMESQFRLGFVRPDGIDGNAVYTSYRLIFFLPLVVWYSLKGKIVNYAPLILTILALIVMQSRAAVVGAAASLGIVIFCIGFTSFSRKRGGIIGLIKMLIILSLCAFVLIPMFPAVFAVGQEFAHFFLRIGEGLMGSTIATKINRIPMALEYFFSNPFSGYGSPRYVYMVLMRTDDIPSILIYLLSGGLLMGISYLVMIFSLPLMPLRLIRRKALLRLNSDQVQLLIFSSAAFMGGIVVVFSNWCENHFSIMFMLYVSIFKIYYLKTRYRSYYTKKSQ